MLRLDYKTIKSITQGAVRVTDEDGYRFFRFTEEQEEVYRKYRADDMLRKTFSTSGVCLEFKTDSEELYIEYDVMASSSRGYYAFDVLCDGELIGSASNFREGEILFEREYILKPENKHFKLASGMKTIKVVFPWSTTPIIKVIGLDDNSVVEPAAKKDKILMFGDSITHGYDAIHPTLSYAYMLSDKLGLEVYNKAIGGEIFFPELGGCKDEFVPKLITVAYGTNDWSLSSLDKFKQNIKGFYDALTGNYPDTKIFSITPIWRKDCLETRDMGCFDTVKKCINDIAKDYRNITVIDGLDFVPHDEEYYADLRIHPNAEGFIHYANNLYNAIAKYI